MLVACSGVKPYPDTLEKNVRVVTRTDGSFLSKVRTAVDIYRVDQACETSYQGTVQLQGPNTLVGLPHDQPVYLVFVFHTSSFLANSKTSTLYETMFRPEPSAHYEFEVSYANKIYGVQMRKAMSDGSWTTVEDQSLDC